MKKIILFLAAFLFSGAAAAGGVSGGGSSGVALNAITSATAAAALGFNVSAAAGYSFTLTGGAAGTSGYSGGAITLTGGTGNGTGGIGGVVSLIGGSGGGIDNPSGGNVIIRGGTPGASGYGGSVLIDGGLVGTGTQGNVKIGTGAQQSPITLGQSGTGNTNGLVLANDYVRILGWITDNNGFKVMSMGASGGASISSGFNTTGGACSQCSNTSGFKITVGTGTATQTGVLGMPSATNSGWACAVADITSPATHNVVETATTLTSITVTDYSRTTGLAQNMNNSDVIVFNCTAI